MTTSHLMAVLLKLVAGFGAVKREASPPALTKSITTMRLRNFFFAGAGGIGAGLVGSPRSGCVGRVYLRDSLDFDTTLVSMRALGFAFCVRCEF